MSSKISIKPKDSSFIRKYNNLTDILADRELASLGDAFVNFVYSLALSRKSGKPIGRKVESDVLATALRKADLRRLLPSRVDRHKQADAAEALIVYAWLAGQVTLDEALDVFVQNTDVDAFSLLLQTAVNRLGFA